MTTGLLALSPQRVMGFALGFSLLFFAASYVAYGNVGIDLADEGYLWYGVQRTLAGEVPLRDFQSYDPGRYYWCAAFASVLGDGLLGVRAAAMAFAAIGLVLAILVAARFARGWTELALCAALLGLWMFPIYKLFEPALACATTWFGVRLLERPTSGRHFAAGAFVGLAGVFGRNHALYAGLALGALALLVLAKERPRGGGRSLARLVLGALVGHAPMWFLLLFVPGFAQSFLASCRIVLEHGTNLPYPWHWPWAVPWGRLGGWDLAAAGALTLVFLLPPVALPLGLVRALRLPAADLRRHAATVAAAFAGAFYVHHAAVRSHPLHLAQCLPPTLLLALGAAAGASGWRRRVLLGALPLVLVVASMEVHPGLAALRPGNRARELVEHRVAGETLRIVAPQVEYLGGLERAIHAVVPADETIFITPNRPGLYCLLGKRAPTWWIYFFWAATSEEQRELIARLEERKVDWVLLPQPLRRKSSDDYFPSTHPEVVEYLQREFERVELEDLNRDDWLLHRRSPLR